MRTVSFVLACLACEGHARGVQPPRSQEQVQHVSRQMNENSSPEALAELLLSSDPTSAFTSSGPGATKPVRKPTRASSSPMMQKKIALNRRNPQKSAFDIKEQAGVTEPLGFFDPVGFSNDISEGRLRFYREVELKHGRLGMLAALGFLVGEQFHPLFGGDIDVPSYLAFQQTPLEKFWPFVVSCIAIAEVYSVFTFNSPAGGEPWSIRSDHEPGNYGGFDPLNLKPTDPKEFRDMQDKELNNGRLAMLAAAGMIAQELVTGQKLF